MTQLITIVPGKRDGWTGIYIGRRMPRADLPALQIDSPLANPYRPTARTAEAHKIVIGQYRRWLWGQIHGTTHAAQIVRAELQRLKCEVLNGQEVKLNCWCDGLPCHAEVVKSCLEWAIETNFDFWHEPVAKVLQEV